MTDSPNVDSEARFDNYVHQFEGLFGQRTVDDNETMYGLIEEISRTEHERVLFKLEPLRGEETYYFQPSAMLRQIDQKTGGNIDAKLKMAIFDHNLKVVKVERFDFNSDSTHPEDPSNFGNSLDRFMRDRELTEGAFAGIFVEKPKN